MPDTSESPHVPYTLKGGAPSGTSVDDIRALVDMARLPPQRPTPAVAQPPSPNGSKPPPHERTERAEPEYDRTERLTDLGNALRFTRLHGNDFRFTTGRGWLAWDGTRWQRDGLGAVQRAAKETVVSLYGEAARLTDRAKRMLEEAAKLELSDVQRAAIAVDVEDAQRMAEALTKWAKACQGRARLDAIPSVASSELPIAALDASFDRNNWLLNCANGTLDLRTGELHPHRREDMLTTLAPTPYDQAAQCPTWEKFLHRIMSGNQLLIDFLQRAVGYSLTGDVGEQVLFFLHGSGANGKSTFINAIFDTLGGDYAVQSAPDLLVQKSGERHPTEVADLQGKRLVASIEVEDGRRMAEGLVKQLTGGDLLKARHMREDFFQFKPTHKLFLVANHKPAVRGTDYAIWRRIRMIPFNVQIPDGERDARMPEKLRAEAPGILAWAVRGCLAWQKMGLAAPAEVTAATEAYRLESDSLGAFLAECTVALPAARTKAKHLYDAYAKWAAAGNLPCINLMRFGNAMAERGFEKDTTRIGVQYVGIGLTDENL